MESAQRKIEEHFIDVTPRGNTSTKLYGPILYSELFALSPLLSNTEEFACALIKAFKNFISPDIDTFFSNFRAENNIRIVISEVLNWCKDFNRDETLAKRILKKSLVFAEWYQQRELTYNQWVVREDELQEMPADILSIGIVKDVERHGLQGVLLRPRLCLATPNTVFLKVFLTCEGKSLMPSSGWHSWRDTHSVVSLIENKARWSMVVPLEGDGDSALKPRFLDEIELFIPYQSVSFDADIKSFAPEVAYSIGLYSRSGEPLSSISRRDIFRRSVTRPPYTLSSYQHSSLQPYCALTGTYINDISLKQNSTGNLDCELSLSIGDYSDISHMEVRVLNQNGDLITGLSECTDRCGAFYLENDLADIIDSGGRGKMKFIIPLEKLDIDKGFHRLHLEIIIIGLEHRVLCGALEPYNIFVNES